MDEWEDDKAIALEVFYDIDNVITDSNLITMPVSWQGMSVKEKVMALTILQVKIHSLISELKEELR